MINHINVILNNDTFLYFLREYLNLEHSFYVTHYPLLCNKLCQTLHMGWKNWQKEAQQILPNTLFKLYPQAKCKRISVTPYFELRNKLCPTLHSRGRIDKKRRNKFCQTLCLNSIHRQIVNEFLSPLHCTAQQKGPNTLLQTLTYHAKHF